MDSCRALHPHTRRTDALHRLERALAGKPDDSVGVLAALGAAAWVLDESELAVRVLGQAMDQLRRAATAGTNATVGQALALGLFETGSWTAALTAAEDAYRAAAEAGADNVTVGSPLLQATLHAVCGDHEAARAQAQEAVRGIDLRKSRSLHVRYRHALGLAAVVAGDHDNAYDLLRGASATSSRCPFTTTRPRVLPGRPRRRGRPGRPGRTMPAPCSKPPSKASAPRGPPRPRRRPACRRPARRLRGRSSSTSSPLSPIRHAPAGPSNSPSPGWTSASGCAAADVPRSRPMLSGALEIFQRLGAQPWAERAAAETPGRRCPGVPTGRGPEVELTPQERQIANGRAGPDQPRHRRPALRVAPDRRFRLHKIFPKLGISSRHQLRDLLFPAPVNLPNRRLPRGAQSVTVTLRSSARRKRGARTDYFSVQPR